MTASFTPTWTLSGFGDEIHEDPRIQIAVLQALGAQHIEVRSAWGINIVELDDARLEELRALLAEQEMGVSAIASPLGKVDITSDFDAELARLDRAINAAKVLNSRYIRIFSFYYGEGVDVDSIREPVIERLTRFAEIAQAAGIVLLHENEKDIYGDTPARVLDLITSVNSPALRVAWDNANYVQVGAVPFDDGFEDLRPYLEYLQVKDALASDHSVVAAGEGDGQLRETLGALASDGFAGFASLEPHLSDAFATGGFSGAAAFGRAARAFRGLTDELGVTLK
ncbi:sugar phosphate isomerase/epimerase [Mycetocola sp. BIGb0189]|uniref:sugar phosphate isomerase/epimerase family protein n=1 Tax=Mycetocola sp. BIGb0189 TaxID=2940604 RepID=UPI00216989D7|nr:sugar phosphate isomerase/epimerase family protein [Mycetocola sp. BIGb0189]MCS4275409.1 sugar phosphate isomerase/epimerase [Mycetocola sp. BIGb0189]